MVRLSRIFGDVEFLLIAEDWLGQSLGGYDVNIFSLGIEEEAHPGLFTRKSHYLFGFGTGEVRSVFSL